MIVMHLTDHVEYFVHSLVELLLSVYLKELLQKEERMLVRLLAFRYDWKAGIFPVRLKMGPFEVIFHQLNVNSNKWLLCQEIVEIPVLLICTFDKVI